MSLVLPEVVSARRAWRRSFWLVLSLGAGVLAAAVLRTLPATGRLLAGAAVCAGTALPGLVRPGLAVAPMRAWNRAARLAGRIAALWIAAVCFYVVLALLGKAGSALRLEPPEREGSLWTPWASDGGPTEALAAAGGPGRLWAEVAAWARRSGNTWAWALLPFFILLSLLDVSAEADTPPPGIYTLY